MEIYLGSSKDDPRYISGELVHHTKGTACAYSKIGISLGRIDVTDPRWKTGEIRGRKNSDLILNVQVES